MADSPVLILVGDVSWRHGWVHGVATAFEGKVDTLLRPLPTYSAHALMAAAPHLLAESTPRPLAIVVAVPLSAAAPAAAAAVAAAAAAAVDATGAGRCVVLHPAADAPTDAAPSVVWTRTADPTVADVVAALGIDPASMRACLPPAVGDAAPAASLAAWRGEPPPAPPGARALYAPRAADRDAVPRRAECALVIVDAQNYSCRPASALWAGRADTDGAYFFGRLAAVVEPAWVALVAAARAGGVPIIFTVMAGKTDDGAADVCADYRTSGFVIPARSWDARVVASLTPSRRDVVLPKGSCNAFASSELQHVLRSLGARHAVVAGVVSDQCVAAAAATAADLNFGVTYVVDGVAALGEAREAAAVESMRGFARLRTAAQVVAEWGAA